MMDELPNALRGARILVAEDEGTLALDLMLSLQDAGATVLGPVASIEDATSLAAREEAITAAVLDVNLHGQKIYPFAEVLAQRRVPLIFTTGYDKWVVPPQFSQIPRMEKPVDIAALVRLLTALVGQTR